MFFYLLSIFAISYDKYAIVVDAGSTKTTCYVYGYNGDKNPVQINKESLNYILYDVLLTDILKSELFGSSSPFTALVTNNIPSGNRNDCTFSLLATCLRDFPENQVDSIFSIYRDYLVSQNVWKDFKYENTSFSVLSSQMEGVLLWIAINHRAGFFSGSQDNTAITSISSTATTLAFLEKSNPKDGYHAKITWNKKEYTIFASGFDRYGIDSAISNASLTLSSTKGSSFITSPCFLNGEVNYKFPKNYQSEEYRYPLLYITGKGNYQECSENFKTTILIKGECSFDKCLINEAPYYELPKSIAVMGLYPRLKAYFSQQSGDFAWPGDSIKAVTNLATKYCATKNTDVPVNEYSDQYCYQFAYSLNFLTAILKYDESTIPNWATESISWTYSTVLQRAYGKDLTIEFILKKKDYTATIIIGIVVGITFIAVIVYIILKFCRTGKSRKKKTDEQTNLISNNENNEINENNDSR